MKIQQIPVNTPDMQNGDCLKSGKAHAGFHLRYSPALDGLRGVAVLAVLSTHLHLPFSEHGDLGVDIFFALSGFLITVLLSEEWKKHRSIRLGQFYIRRILRLYPALLLMLLIVSFFTSAREYILSSLIYMTNWVIALNIRPLNMELGHTWTLAIEEQYYLLWPPFLLLLLSRLPPRKVILFPLGLGAISLILRVISWTTIHDFWRYNAGTDMHADGLLFGSALGLAAVFDLLPKNIIFPKALKASTILLSVVMVWLCVIAPPPADFFPYVGNTAVAMTTLLIISLLVIYPSKKIKWIFELTPLVNVGKISYGLYLWQVPIIVLLNFEAVGMNHTVSSIVKVVLIFLITIFSYRYLEKPIQRLKGKFSVMPISP